MTCRDILELTSSSPDDTARIAQQLGAFLGAGDVVLMHGPVGAGKSHFARAVIQSRLAAMGRYEDVPSPTFTLIQVYDLSDCEIWHADLYRLSAPEDVIELGLDQAFDDAISLVEWPERLGALTPRNALHLRLTPFHDDTRRIQFCTDDPDWQVRLQSIFATAHAPKSEA